ncbi:MAG: hypothetical protein J0L84_08590 [Verrucomicrobia bacterium]|nr:hypothetical protein [Verrucomicrobiota bacterium]
MTSPHPVEGSPLHLRSWFGSCLRMLAGVLGAAALAQSPPPADLVMDMSATVSRVVPRIRLSWSQKLQSRTTAQRIHRRLKGTSGWTKLADLSIAATGFSDSTALDGVEYEYWLERPLNASPGMAVGYLDAGAYLPAPDSRGKLLLVVDASLAGAIAADLQQLERDLSHDGWTVQRISVSRTATVKSVRSAIQSAYQADRANVRMVYLLGHVPVPYSGNNSPDGHPEHRGAWPADGYYGDMDGVWTDSWLYNIQASSGRNDNVPGDGKFDQSNFPSLLELAVGRVDLSALTKAPSSAVTEAELLRRYLRKAHDYRTKSGAYAAIPRRVIIHDALTSFSTGLSGWHWGASALGRPGVVPFDVAPGGAWFTTNYAGGRSYLVGYAGGYGSQESVSGVGTTADFGWRTHRVVFLGMFGSYFGDWDSPNNIMRSVLAGNAAGTSLGLATMWAGAPTYFMHSTGMGNPIGLAVRDSQNALLPGGTGYRPGGPRWGSYDPLGGVFTGLMGDPALRLHVVAPPRKVTVTSAQGRVSLAWAPSPETDLVGYHVYRSASPTGPFTRITRAALAAPAYAENATVGATYTYLVKTLRLERSPGGTYFNHSIGTPVTHTVNGGAATSGAVAVELEPYRTAWIIGRDDSPLVTPYAPSGEFSNENGLADLPPGQVTRVAGDPLFNALNNPRRDDDYYCVGTYPVGFNGLKASLVVPNQEPAAAWERGLAHQDRTNRAHFLLTSSQANLASKLRLNFEFAQGGFWLGSPYNRYGAGFGVHDVVVRFRNGAGVSTVIYSNRLDRPTRVSVEVATRTVAASVGANTLEFVRTGPVETGNAYWVVFDYVSLESAVPKTVAPQSAAESGGTGDPAWSVLAAGPAGSASSPEPSATPGVLRDASGDHLTLSYVRPDPAPEGLDYRVEVSSDLRNWSEDGLRTLLGPPTSGERRVTVQDMLPVSDHLRRFLRLRLIRFGQVADATNGPVEMGGW